MAGNLEVMDFMSFEANQLVAYFKLIYRCKESSGKSVLFNYHRPSCQSEYFSRREMGSHEYIIKNKS